VRPRCGGVWQRVVVVETHALPRFLRCGRAERGAGGGRDLRRWRREGSQPVTARVCRTQGHNARASGHCIWAACALVRGRGLPRTRESRGSDQRECGEETGHTRQPESRFLSISSHPLFSLSRRVFGVSRREEKRGLLSRALYSLRMPVDSLLTPSCQSISSGQRVAQPRPRSLYRVTHVTQHSVSPSIPSHPALFFTQHSVSPSTDEGVTSPQL
jgi:hypothetical protein